MVGHAAKDPAERQRLLRAIDLHRAGMVQDAMAGYREVLASNPLQFDAWRLLGAGLLSSGRHVEAIDALSRALTIFAGLPEVWAHLGDAHALLGAHAQAAASYERALAADPRQAGVWSRRAAALDSLGRRAEALASYEQAALAAPASASVWCNLGLAQATQRRFEDALASYERAIDREPSSRAAWRGKAAALTALGRCAEALASCERALACAPSGAAPPDRALSFCRGLLQLTLGDLPSGWEGFEARRDAGTMLPEGVEPWRRGTPLTGRRLLLVHEQGLGDTIQFCRFARRLSEAGATVMLQAPSTLLPLLRTLDGVAQIVATDTPPPHADLACALPSVPHRLGLGMGDIPPAPYLAVDPDKRRAWAERLGAPRALRIGLVVSGNPAHDNDSARSIRLREFASLLGANFEWHLLQKELAPGDETDLRRLPIADHRNRLRDFSDTAALAAAMDVVISVDTAIAHLAGALGLPLLLLLPFVPDWRWLLERSDSPWYASARLFRQAKRDDWQPVLARVGEALTRLAKS